MASKVQDRFKRDSLLPHLYFDCFMSVCRISCDK